jgi:hypothetical protein
MHINVTPFQAPLLGASVKARDGNMTAIIEGNLMDCWPRNADLLDTLNASGLIGERMSPKLKHK